MLAELLKYLKLLYAFMTILSVMDLPTFLMIILWSLFFSDVRKLKSIWQEASGYKIWLMMTCFMKLLLTMLITLMMIYLSMM